MHYHVVILQECASQAFTLIAEQVGDSGNEEFLANVNKLFIKNNLYSILLLNWFIWKNSGCKC